MPDRQSLRCPKRVKKGSENRDHADDGRHSHAVYRRIFKENPDVNFEAHDGITYTLYDYLQEGIIDISVVRTPLRLDDVESAVLHSEPMIAVSNPEMPSERRKSLILEDLVHRPLILYRRYEKLIMDAFHTQNLVPEVFCLCDDARALPSG